MKRILLQFLFWSWIASVIVCIVAVYAASWRWTLAIVGYMIVSVAIVGFVAATSKAETFAARERRGPDG